MNRIIALAALGTLLTACDGGNVPVAPDLASRGAGDVRTKTNHTGYLGRATAVDARMLGVTTRFCDAGPLLSSGGSLKANSPSASLQGVLTAGALGCSTDGGNEVVSSEVSVANLGLTVGGNSISAAILNSVAAARCISGTPSSSGRSGITSLVINGQSIVVSGAPNQTISLPNGKVVINEQTQSATKFHSKLTVTALHVVVNEVAAIAVAKSLAGIDLKCGT